MLQLGEGGGWMNNDWAKIQVILFHYTYHRRAAAAAAKEEEARDMNDSGATLEGKESESFLNEQNITAFKTNILTENIAFFDRCGDGGARQMQMKNILALQIQHQCWVRDGRCEYRRGCSLPMQV